LSFAEKQSVIGAERLTMATAADEEDYDRAMEQAAYQSGALTDAIKALGHLRLRT
jgi:hypothetical protein